MSERPRPNEPGPRDSIPTNEQKEQWVDSMLDALYGHTESHSQDLVTQGMKRLESAHLKSQVTPPSNEVPAPPVDAATDCETETPVDSVQRADRVRMTRRQWPWIVLVVAAMLMMGIFIPLSGTGNSLQAAIERTIEQATQDVGRHYQLTTVRFGGRLTRQADLYVKGASRFTIKAPGPLNQPIWIGSVDNQAWALLPIGPILESNTDEMVTWIARSRQIETPFLHLSTILQRMRNAYDLEGLPDVTVETKAGRVRCQHIVARLKSGQRTDIPQQIELWTDRKSGVAMKLIARWDQVNDRRRRDSVTIEFQEETYLEDDFFTPEAHGGQSRKRIRLNSKNHSVESMDGGNSSSPSDATQN